MTPESLSKSSVDERAPAGVTAARDRATLRKVDGRLMQRLNRALALTLIRGDATLTRASLARRTGLSKATVSAIVDHLIAEGLVREEEALATGALGRRPLRLAFNPEARVTLGVAIGVEQVRVGLVTLGGAQRALHVAPLPAGASPADALALAARLAEEARTQPAHTFATPALLPGVGLAVPGMVRWPEGVSLFSPNLGWRDAPIRTLAEEAFGSPVLVDNEIRAMALAETTFGAARRARNALFLDASYGVGGAILLDGALYRGVRGAAGELGHNTVEPDGPRCGCGNFGCLEVYASEHGLIARAREALAAGRASSLAALPALTLDAIVAAADAGDSLARELLDRAARYLGLAVANAVDNWDPELVVLSGSVLDHVFDEATASSRRRFDTLLETERRAVIKIGKTGGEDAPIVRATLGADAKVIGAATLVIADFLAAPEGQSA